MNKITKLVSVLYDDFYPFASVINKDHKPFPAVKTLECIDNPNDLTPDSVLLLWGGGDIHPSLYGKKRSKESGAYVNGPSRRDEIEWACLHRAVEIGVPIIGICRGAQMLCAAAGGYLMQHVDNHAGYGHTITTDTGDIYKVNSLHHQMMVPFEVDHELLAWSTQSLSDIYHDEDHILNHIKCEPELVVFPKIKGIAAQWHPEMMKEDAEATQYLLGVINQKIESWQ